MIFQEPRSEVLSKEEAGMDVFQDWADRRVLKTLFKGILHQKIFYRLNLIFWIVMGCGIARFGRKGLKTTET